MKKSSVLKTLIASVLAIILCLSIIIPVFADDELNPISSGTDSKNPAGAAITKQLQIPIGTKIPTGGITFKFDVTLTAVDEKEDSAIEAGDIPQIDDEDADEFTIEITYPASDFTNLLITYDYDDDGNIFTLINESEDIFADVVFPHEGLYQFEITEQTESYTIADDNHETLTYSGAKYLVTAYVTTDKDGVLFVKFISAFVVIPDDEEEQEEDDKVDPTPGGGPEGDHSEMVFTNTYVRTNGSGDGEEEPEDSDDATLIVSKTVTGDFGNKSLYFDFTLTITVPELVTEPKEAYIAYIVEEISEETEGLEGPVVTISYDVIGDPIEFENETPNTFKLKHGQKLVFVDTPVGTVYEVEETGSVGYKPSVIVVYDGKAKPNVTGTQNNKLGVEDELVGEDENSADFTNDNDTKAPTGLDLNDLPFIGMIVLAIVGISVYLIFKMSRKNPTQK